jgi:putative membrane protein
MKTTHTTLKLMVASSALFVGLMLTQSCSESPKNKKVDTKETAEEQNEQKYDDTKKEKDAEFMVKAAEIHLQEIQLAKLALSVSKNKDVLALAKDAEKFHTDAFAELKNLAAKQLVTIPMSITEDGQKEVNTLKEKSLNDFDEAYAEMLKSSHKDAVEKFEKYATESDDSDTKKWAMQNINTLRSHLDMAIATELKIEKAKKS